MAGRTTRPNGDTWITVKAANGKRRHVRLGSLGGEQAAEAKRRLTQIERHFHQGEPLDPLSVAWLAAMDGTRRDRVIATGLIERSAAPAPAELPTLGRLVIEWTDTLEVAASTLANYQQTTELVLRCYGASKPVAEILPADADRFAAWARREGRVQGRAGSDEKAPLSRASVSRALGTVRSLFAFACRAGWISSNPFQHVRRGGEVNEDRYWYVTPRLIDRLIAEATDHELRTMLALSRYVGLRGPSEFQGVRWEDIDWSEPTIKITAPKTVRHAGGLLRVAPLEDKPHDCLQALWSMAEKGQPAVFPRLGHKSSSDISGKLEAVCRRVGVPLWPKPWTNLRASCETDWIKSGIDIFTTSQWMGHSPEIALRHYRRIAAHIADLPAAYVERTGETSGSLSDQGEALRSQKQRPSEAPGETPGSSAMEPGFSA